MKTDLTETKVKVSADSLVKCYVGSEIWLIPNGIFSLKFLDAARKLNKTTNENVIDWTDDEKAAFEAVWNHPNVWRPL